MHYKDLTQEQIFSGEIEYELDDFERDFREDLLKTWGSKKLDKKYKNGNNLYHGLLFIISFTSQGKTPREINEIILGYTSKDLEEALEHFIDMYQHEIQILQGFQMKMFLENLKQFRVSDSLNLMLLNADFRKWLTKVMEKEYKQ